MWRRLLLALGLSLAAGGAWAQQLSLPESQVLECLTPGPGARGLPAYADELVRARVGGAVRVELVFSSPTAPPGVRVLTPDPIHALVQSVREHVDRFRLPCQTAGSEPARLQLDFVFRPDDGRPVVALPPTDEIEAEQRRVKPCLTRIAGPAQPAYPWQMVRSGTNANALWRLRFVSPTQPPTIRELTDEVHPTFSQAVADFVTAYRLPCLGASPVELDITFQFLIDGSERAIFDDMDLRRLLSGAKRFPQPARFDTQTMGCPFDLRVQHFQPFKAHVVGQLGEARPERAEFVAWVSRVELNIPRPMAQQLVAQTFTLHVPCISIDL